MLQPKETATFRKDLKRALKRGKTLNKLKETVLQLLSSETLTSNYRDHALKGEWVGFRECHIESDWLLIYQVSELDKVLYLVRTGTHADLFNR